MTNNHYSKEFINKIKTNLHDRQAEVKKQLRNFTKHDPKQKDNYNANFPQFGEKEDENAAEVPAFERNLHLEETLEQTLEMINKALKKIEKGTYGICEKTGKYITIERLEIMPTATKCAPKDLLKNV